MHLRHRESRSGKPGLVPNDAAKPPHSANTSSGTQPQRLQALTLMHVAVAFSVGSEKLGTIVISSSLALKYICKRYGAGGRREGCR